MMMLISFLALACTLSAAVDVPKVPAWSSEMKASSTQKCIHVPATEQYNYSNNSRWAFTQVPQGTPPAAGWPVLIQLAIIPFAAEGEAPYTPNGTTPKCGMDGLLHPMFPWDNVDMAAGMAAISATNARAVKRRQRLSNHGAEPLRELTSLPPPGPPAPPSYWRCMGSMAQLVGEAAFLRSPDMSAAQTQYCLEAANATRYFPRPNSSGYEKVWVLPVLLRQGGCTMEMIARGCSPPAKKCSQLSFLSSDSAECASLAANCSATGGAYECTSQPCPAPGPCQLCENYCSQPGPDPESDLMEQLNCSFTTAQHACSDHRGDPQSRYMAEEYHPFENPPDLMSPCSCFQPNGTYRCPTIPDHGHHMEAGPGCSFDLLAGAMWFQRQKQYLLENGIAVMTVNTREFDGWNIDVADWKVGCDPPFFSALAKEISNGDLGPIDPARVAFHGWSGGAQMVSNLAHIWAAGMLPGLTMKAGVMLSGGSQQCYNVPPLASAQCADCDPSEQCMTPGCSADVPAGTKPCCYMCCPQGYTEQWFKDHPEQYARHPAMFLGQVSTDDVQADGCAAKYYHEAMQANNATSELHLIPLDKQRCYSVGQPEDPAAAKASQGHDKYSEYCDSGPGLRSMNHTMGSAEMVEPLVKFLMAVL